MKCYGHEFHKESSGVLVKKLIFSGSEYYKTKRHATSIWTRVWMWMWKVLEHQMIQSGNDTLDILCNLNRFQMECINPPFKRRIAEIVGKKLLSTYLSMKRTILKKRSLNLNAIILCKRSFFSQSICTLYFQISSHVFCPKFCGCSFERALKKGALVSECE